MTREVPVFIIQPESIKEAARAKRELGNDKGYNNEIDKRTTDDHPFLQDYLIKINQEQPFNKYYNLGTFMMYDVISRQLDKNQTKIAITGEDMEQHAYNYDGNDYEIFTATYWDNLPDLYEALGDTTQQNGLSQFFGKIENSSPVLYQKMAEIIAEGLIITDERRFFTRGIYDVFMPFYRKKEAEHLFNTLYQTTNQQNE